MFPLSDSARAPRFPFINLALVGITIFVFIQQLIAPNQEAFVFQYALVPANISLSDPMTLLPFVTAMFLHGGFMHILSNMWFLVVFGDNIEGHLGVIGFLLLYFLAGIAGNFVQYLFMPTSPIPMLGASGAVAGILGAYLVLFPASRIRTLLFAFFLVTVVEIPAIFMLGYWFVLQIISGATSIPGIGEQGGVAFFAHIAGFVVGMLFGFAYKRKSHDHTYEGDDD
jgi:membrane associated rhomboid family serine protease